MSRVGSGETDTMTDGTNDEVVCLECLEGFGQITASHLSMHGMTVEEYREKHDDPDLVSGSVKAKSGWSEDSHGFETREKISEGVKEAHDRGDYRADA